MKRFKAHCSRGLFGRNSTRSFNTMDELKKIESDGLLIWWITDTESLKIIYENDLMKTAHKLSDVKI